MKRPLVWLCALWILFIAVSERAGVSDEDAPPAQAIQKLLEAAGTDGMLTLSGVVSQCSALPDETQISIDHISIHESDDSQQSIVSEFKITFTTEENKALPGDTVCVRGEIREYTEATNPGQFDARTWYFSQDIIGSMKNAQILSVQTGHMTVTRGLYQLKQLLMDSYRRILDDKPARIISAISLGERGLLDQEWKTVYQEGGIAHILAVSGLHITLIGMGLYQLLRRFGAGFAAAAVPSGIAVCLYAVLCGSGASALRAFIMFCIWLGAQVCGRKYDMVTAVFAAAMLLLTGNGDLLFQAAFLLSFGAVLSLGILRPQLDAVFGSRLPVGGLISGCAIYLGTIPITLYFYYQITPWGLLVNLAVLFLMSSLMIAGLAAAVIGLLFVPAGIFLAAPVSYILSFFEWICNLEQHLPGAVLVLGRPEIWQILLYYAVLSVLIFLTGKKIKDGKIHVPRIIAAAVWLVGMTLCLSLMTVRSRDTLTVTCMDVGQGDGALIQFPTGENCLIDGGSSSKSSLWKNIISQTVKYYGIRRLDYIFLSHADQDHVSGIIEGLEEYGTGLSGNGIHGITIGALVLPPTADASDFEELLDLAHRNGIMVLRMKAGDVIGLSQPKTDLENAHISAADAKTDSEADKLLWSITCLSPEADLLSGDKNQDSMVLRLQYGDFSMLFTGDLEEEAEASLAESGENLRSDVLKVGHHGSKKASSESFLAAVSPQIAVISCGKDNRYGHPAPDTVNRLMEAGCMIWQTQENGAVTLQSDGRTYTVNGAIG